MFIIANWFAGYIGLITKKIEQWSQLDNYKYKWNEDGKTLKSFIKLDPVELLLKDGVKLISGTLFYEYINDTKRIVSEDGKYKVVDKSGIIDTHWTKFWFSEKSFIIIEKGNNGRRILEIISEALFEMSDSIKPVEFDIDRIARDYPSHWLGGFYDREGHINTGTLYGEDIIVDEEMGDAYAHTKHKNQVGIITDYFDGVETKIKVTRSGYVQIYGGFNENPDIPFEFIRDEIIDYAITD